MEKNAPLPTDCLKSYVTSYAVTLSEALRGLDEGALEAAYARLKQCAERGGTIFVAGNGGSAAVSEHLQCDFMKGAGLRVVSLCSGLPLLTALANDESFENIFAARLHMHYASSRDICILISSSGNSPNILQAARSCGELGVTVIGLTGFSGGQLRSMCDVSLHVPVQNYGIAEDAHSCLMHCLSQFRVAQVALTKVQLSSGLVFP